MRVNKVDFVQNFMIKANGQPKIANGTSVSASAKLNMYDSRDSITQKKAHHVERNIRGVIKDN